MTRWPSADQVDRVPNKDRPCRVQVVSVHDGDTFTALVPVGSAFLKMDIRLLGIDCPELAEPAGAAVQRIVAARILNKEVTIVAKRWDKFGGRLLAEAFLPDSTNLVTFLLEYELGKPYHGNKKEPWTAEQLSAIEKTCLEL